MTKIKPILIAALAFMAAMSSSCSKEECNALVPNNTNEEKSTISVSVSGMIGEFANGEGAKAGMVNSVRVKWAAGDKVYAYDAENNLGELEVSLKDGNDYYAVLNGEIDEPAGDKIFLVYGSALTEAPAISGGKIAFDLSTQASASGDYTESPFVAYSTMEYSGKKEISGKTVNFTFASSIMRLNCTGLEPNVAVKSAKLTGISNECVIDLSGDEAAVTDGQTGDISLSFTSLKASANGAGVFYASIAKNGTAAAQTLEVKQTKTYEWSFGNRSREAGVSINAICQLKDKVYYFTVSDKSGSPYDAKKIKFAPGNLFCTRTGGADNWTYSFEFEANQYDYRTINDGTIKGKCVINGVEKAETELNTSGFFVWNCKNGVISEDYGAFTSPKDAVQGADTDKMDWGVAYNNQHPGENWRTLTKNEWNYLVSIRRVNGKTGYGNVCVWAKVNSVFGLIIYPDNYDGTVYKCTYYNEEQRREMTYIPEISAEEFPEGCVFLPAAGYLEFYQAGQETRILGNGSQTSYWSSTAANYQKAWYLCIAKAIASVTDFSRQDGFCVRLVSEL